MSRVARWAHCPGCGRRRERWPSDAGGLCVRCQVRLAVERSTGDYSTRAELVVRAARRHTHWEVFAVERDAAVYLAAAIDQAARHLCPGDRAEVEWAWDDAADRPTGAGRLRLRPASWPAADSPPASVLGAAPAHGDE